MRWLGGVQRGRDETLRHADAMKFGALNIGAAVRRLGALCPAMEIYNLWECCCASFLLMYGNSYRVSKVHGKQTNSERGVPQLKMRSNYYPSNAIVLTTFALCNSIIAIALPAISSGELSARGRPIFNPIECDAELPIFPPGLQSSYHNLRNVCARDSLINSGNMGCFCADEVLYCPIISTNPPWLFIIRNYCLSSCDCGADTKSRVVTLGARSSLDLSTPPWNVKEDGPNPFRDIAARPMNVGTCTSCFMFGSSVLPRDGGENCSCVNSSSITPRDGERKGHASILDGSRKDHI